MSDKSEREENDDSEDTDIRISPDETLFFTIPKEGIVTEIGEATNDDGENYKYHRLFLATAFEPVQPVVLRCSRSLAVLVRKAATMSQLPTKIAVTREGEGLKTRYNVTPMRAENERGK